MPIEEETALLHTNRYRFIANSTDFVYSFMRFICCIIMENKNVDHNIQCILNIQTSIYVVCLFCVYTVVNRRGWVGTHEEGTFHQPQHHASFIRNSVEYCSLTQRSIHLLCAIMV